ncbi:MAG: hypothetical protein HUU56_17865 [Bdellovibrionaceae bacterium]|nr:hypothetical protein [Pseudobdellovibrionaceae bacterium]
MADKKIYSSPAEAWAARQEEHRNNDSVVRKFTAQLIKYISSRGGLDQIPKLWAFVSKNDFCFLQGALISDILNGDDWQNIRGDNKKIALNINLCESYTIYKFKKNSTFWLYLFTEVRMGAIESRLVKIDTKLGNIIECPHHFKFPSAGYPHPDKEEFKEFVQNVENLSRYLMS